MAAGNPKHPAANRYEAFGRKQRIMQATQGEQFDYVVVGAGSAGCVLANRFSANPKTRACLIEAGPADNHPPIRIPLGIAKLLSHHHSMSHPDDIDGLVHSISIAPRLVDTPHFDQVRGDEIEPGSALTSDEELARFIREHTHSAYHPAGTCPMAGSNAVVDPQLRIRGLRIVDASVRPTLPNGNNPGQAALAPAMLD